MSAESREPVILGAADGLVIMLGLVAGMAVAHQAASAIWHAALAGGVAELVGMTAGMWLSDGEARFPRALACGVASLVACVLPAVPYALSSGAWALTATGALITLSGVVVAWLRPAHNAAAFAQTFGVLVVAAILTGGTGLL